MNARVLISLVIIAAAVATISVRSFYRSGVVPAGHNRELAVGLAEWIVNEVRNDTRGDVLILDQADASNDSFVNQLSKRLVSNLKKSGFSNVESLIVPYSENYESTGEPVTRDVFFAALSNHPNAQLVVSLIGVPRLVASDLPTGHRPRLIVASTAHMSYVRVLPAGIVEFVIEDRQDQNAAPTDPSLGELNRHFVLVRPQ